MFEFVLIFKLIIYFFLTIPLLLLCISKKKTSAPPPKSAPRSETPVARLDNDNDTITESVDCVLSTSISVKPEVPEKKEISKVEVKKPPRHSTEISINTGFELDKGAKSSTASVMV